MGSRLQSAGSAGAGHRLSCSETCGIFLDQGSNPRPQHEQADSQPLSHQESPPLGFYKAPSSCHTERAGLEKNRCLTVQAIKADCTQESLQEGREGREPVSTPDTPQASRFTAKEQVGSVNGRSQEGT